MEPLEEVSQKYDMTKRQRLIHYIYTTFILLISLGLVAVSVIQINMLRRYTNKYDMEIHPFTIAVCVVALISTIAAAFGFLAAFSNQPSLLLMYMIFLIPLTVALIACAVAAGVFLHNADETNTYTLNLYMYKMQRDPRYADFLNRSQAELCCCGANGPSDYESSAIPPSCYDDNGVLHYIGCSEKLTEKIHLLTGFILAFSLLSGLLYIMAGYLANNYRNALLVAQPQI